MHISGTSKTTAFKKSLVLIRTRKKRQKAARRYNLGRFAAWHIGKGKCFLALVAPLAEQLVFQVGRCYFNSFLDKLVIFLEHLLFHRFQISVDRPRFLGVPGDFLGVGIPSARMDILL